MPSHSRVGWEGGLTWYQMASFYGFTSNFWDILVKEIKEWCKKTLIRKQIKNPGPKEIIIIIMAAFSITFMNLGSFLSYLRRDNWAGAILWGTNSVLIPKWRIHTQGSIIMSLIEMLWVGKIQSSINLCIAPLSRVQLSILVLRSLETTSVAKSILDLLYQGQSEL